MRDKGVWLASYKQVNECRQSVVIPSMFPSGRSRKNQAEDNHNSELGETHLDGSTGSSVDVADAAVDPLHEFDEEVCEFPLERCMRIVPHDQNSGAFFIAVLHKVSPLPGMLNCPTFGQGQLRHTCPKPFRKCLLIMPCPGLYIFKYLIIAPCISSCYYLALCNILFVHT